MSDSGNGGKKASGTGVTNVTKVAKITNVADWKPLLDELRVAQARARAMGGPERVERLMYARGKLDARARIALLFDPGSFVEIGALVGGPDIPADALVAGMGRIDGRPALAGAEDFSVLGGSIGMGSMAKRTASASSRLQERVPLVMMLEGAGHRLTGTLAGGSRPERPARGSPTSRASVPMVCLVLGASAGHGALTAPLSDFVDHDRGGLDVHGRTAAREGRDRRGRDEGRARRRKCAPRSRARAQRRADDASAIALARRYLGYFPRSAARRRRRATRRRRRRVCSTTSSS